LDLKDIAIRRKEQILFSPASYILRRHRLLRCFWQNPLAQDVVAKTKDPKARWGWVLPPATA
jgi:hypothetical protein